MLGTLGLDAAAHSKAATVPRNFSEQFSLSAPTL